MDSEFKKLEKQRRRQELGIKANMALEYVERETIEEIEKIQSALSSCLSAEKIDKDRILVLTSKEASLRDFVKRVTDRIKQSSKE